MELLREDDSDESAGHGANEDATGSFFEHLLGANVRRLFGADEEVGPSHCTGHDAAGGAKIDNATSAAKAAQVAHRRHPTSRHSLGSSSSSAVDDENAFKVVGLAPKVTIRSNAQFFTIETVNTGHSGLHFVIQVSGVSRPRTAIRDNGDGTYTCEWRPQTSGNYRLMVSHKGNALPGSPFRVLASTPEPCASKCMLRGDALTRATGRATQSFEVAYRDFLAATTHAVELDVFVEPVPVGSPRDKPTSRKLRRRTTEGRSNGPSSFRGGKDGTPRTSWSPPSSQRRRLVADDRATPRPSWTPPTSERRGRASTDAVSETTRFRRIRVKVMQKLVVRAGISHESELLGRLLPGAIVTVIEEHIISAGNIRACIALDHLQRESDDGRSTGRSTPAPSFRRSTPRLSERPLGSTRRVTLSTREMPKHERSERETTRSTKRSAIASSRPPPLLPSISEDGEASAGVGAEATLSEVLPGDDLADDQDGAAAVLESDSPHADGSTVVLARRGAAHSAKKSQVGGLSLSTSMDATVLSSSPSKRGDNLGDDGETRRTTVRMAAGSEHRGTERSAMPRVGWVTLTKDGNKLVSSRVRLNPSARQQHQQAWARRTKNDKTQAEVEAGRTKEESRLGASMESASLGAVSKAKAASRKDEASGLMRCYSLEKQEDATSFAFGGIYPGTLHAHGQMFQWHKVSYSIGVAGNYLLHVRLRHQAATLPGSPFMLVVEPAEAFALSSKLEPAVLKGEAGESCSALLITSDRMGNTCNRGGANVTCMCASDCVETSCTDLKDGRYELLCNSTRAGAFSVHVLIDGREVDNSPLTVHILSTIPVIANTKFSGLGLTWARLNEPTKVHIHFNDQFCSPTTPSEGFRSSHKVGMRLLSESKQMAMQASKKSGSDDVATEDAPEELPAVWGEEGELEVTYKAFLTGGHRLHLYCMSNDEDGKLQLISFPGSPFKMHVENTVKTVTGDADRGDVEVEAGDYIISRSVFDESQKRWGTCTIDAFASAATALLPVFWSAKPHGGCAGTNAFIQAWGSEERVWAHPPIAQLMTLVQFLSQRKRKSEVVVCAPDWPKFGWYKLLEAMSDETHRYPSGKLQAVADDAPPRCSEWPVVLFHIPAIGRLSIEEKRHGAAVVIQSQVRVHLRLEQPQPLVVDGSTTSPQSASKAQKKGGGSKLRHMLTLFAEKPLSAQAIQGKNESPYGRLPARKAKSPGSPNSKPASPGSPNSKPGSPASKRLGGLSLSLTPVEKDS